MKLSIIIPVYNCGQFLNECIDSIVPEIDEEAEVLLIDDGSQDDSYEICKSYEASNIRVWHQENHGVSYTRNFGIEYAKGDYIMFVDADDRLAKGWYETVKEGIQTNKELILFSEKIGAKEPTKQQLIEFFCTIPKEEKAIGLVATTASSKIHKKEFLQKHNLQFNNDMIFSEDRLFCLEESIAVETVVFIHKSFYLYRYNSSSATNRFDERYLDSVLRYIQRHKVILKQYGQINNQKLNSYELYFWFNMMYTLLYVLSREENNSSAYEKIKIFECDEFKCFFDNYKINIQWELRTNIAYILLKHKYYRAALLYRKILTMLRHSVKDSEHFDLI